MNQFIKTIFFALTVLVSLNLAAQDASKNKKKTEVVYLNGGNYNHEIAEGIVVVDFWASWCGPCRRMDPIIEDLATEFGEKVKFGKVNVDKSKLFSVQMKVRLLPTFIIYKNGKEVERLEGGFSKGSFKKAIEKYMEEDEKLEE